MHEWKMLTFVCVIKMPWRSHNLAGSTLVDLKLYNLLGSFFKRCFLYYKVSIVFFCNAFLRGS